MYVVHVASLSNWAINDRRNDNDSHKKDCCFEKAEPLHNYVFGVILLAKPQYISVFLILEERVNGRGSLLSTYQKIHWEDLKKI